MITHARLDRVAARLLRLIGGGFLFASLVPAISDASTRPSTETSEKPHNKSSVDERIAAIRGRIEKDRVNIKLGDTGRGQTYIAQWYNWPNWPNYWNNWNNWPNYWLNY